MVRWASALLLVGTTLIALACESRTAPSAHGTAANPAPSAAPRPDHFGGRIASENRPEKLADVLAAPERFEGRALVVEGYVRRACSRRGCWMELAEGADPKFAGCRVTFKDYGFFVPTNAAGSNARVQAELELATLSPPIVDHMESEGALFPRKDADGSAREVRLVASGVDLWR